MTMKKIALFAVAFVACNAFAADPEIQLSLGASIQNRFSSKAFALLDKALNTVSATFKGQSGAVDQPVKFKLGIVAEGAGKMVVNGETIRFHAICNIVDTLAGKVVIEGVGDCELKATDGGEATGHFQTLPGVGDLGHFTLKPGTKGFARVSGSVPVDITVNPFKVTGKPVFFVESVQEFASK
jgi:hypothetical protein